MREGRFHGAKEGKLAMSSWDPVTNPAPASAPAAPALRPLSIGELFDRAFSLYFKHILTFAAVLFVATIPYAVFLLLQLYLVHDVLGAEVNLIDAMIKNPSAPPDLTSLQAAMSKESVSAMLGSYVLTILSYLVALFTLPLAGAAVVSGVSRAYLGLPVRFADCFRDAFKRWGYVLLLTLLWVGVMIPISLVVFAVFMFAVIAIALLGAALHTFGLIVGGLFGLALFVALIGLSVMGYMSFAASFVACVLERADPVKSLTLGLSRVFGRDLFTRAMWVALALVALYIGFVIVATIIAGLSVWLTKSFFLYFAVAHIINIFFIAFAFVVISVYYYDVRIRREGFDIQVLADQLTSSTAR
ncbi:MAG: hypothetical protein JO194_06155 [Candidatus Eremiobacteraeota bacterium]|nr:hypothetical protein [Candidatus Eremiobacteraeota bacterium]